MLWRRVFSIVAGVAGIALAQSAFASGGGPATGEIAFVTNQNSSDMSIVDLGARREIARIPVPGRAAGVAAGTRAVYTISPDDATLREYSHDGALCRALVLEGGPIAVALDETAGRIFVSDWYNARIFVVDLEDFSRAGILTTAEAPSGLALSADGRFLVSADRDADSLSIFDARRLALHGTVRVGVRPFGVTFAETGLVYVTNVGSDSVSVVDPAALAVVAEIPTGARPYSVAFAAGRGFVSDQYQDTVTVFDAASHAPVAVIDSGEYPEGLDANAQGSEIYVANWFSNTLGVIDVASGVMVDEIAVGDGPRAFGIFVTEAAARQPGCN